MEFNHRYQDSSDKNNSMYPGKIDMESYGDMGKFSEKGEEEYSTRGHSVNLRQRAAEEVQIYAGGAMEDGMNDYIEDTPGVENEKNDIFRNNADFANIDENNLEFVHPGYQINHQIRRNRLRGRNGSAPVNKSKPFNLTPFIKKRKTTKSSPSNSGSPCQYL